jgi:hypothetical protein
MSGDLLINPIHMSPLLAAHLSLEPITLPRILIVDDERQTPNAAFANIGNYFRSPVRAVGLWVGSGLPSDPPSNERAARRNDGRLRSAPPLSWL